MAKKRFYLSGICIIAICITIFGSGIYKSYAIKDKVSVLMSTDTIDNEVEKNSVEDLQKYGLDLVDDCINKDKSMLIQADNLSEGEYTPDHMGIPYKVFYVNTDSLKEGSFQDALSSYFWEYPVMNANNEFLTTCTMGKYNGKWEPCLINSGLPAEMVVISSSSDDISNILNDNNISDPVAIKHVRFLEPYEFDAFYVQTSDKQEFLIPMSSKPDIMKMENLKAYHLPDVVDGFVNELNIQESNMKAYFKDSNKIFIPAGTEPLKP